MSTKKNTDYVSAIIIDDDDDDIIVNNSIVNNSIVNNSIVNIDDDCKLDEELILVKEDTEEIIPVTKSKRQRKQKNADVNISPVKKTKNISLSL